MGKSRLISLNLAAFWVLSSLAFAGPELVNTTPRKISEMEVQGASAQSLVSLALTALQNAYSAEMPSGEAENRAWLLSWLTRQELDGPARQTASDIVRLVLEKEDPILGAESRTAAMSLIGEFNLVEFIPVLEATLRTDDGPDALIAFRSYGRLLSGIKDRAPHLQFLREQLEEKKIIGPAIVDAIALSGLASADVAIHFAAILASDAPVAVHARILEWVAEYPDSFRNLAIEKIVEHLVLRSGTSDLVVREAFRVLEEFDALTPAIKERTDSLNLRALPVRRSIPVTELACRAALAQLRRQNPK